MLRKGVWGNRGGSTPSEGRTGARRLLNKNTTKPAKEPLYLELGASENLYPARDRKM